MLADMAALESLEHPSANHQQGVLEPGAGTARSNASAPRWRVNYCLNRRKNHRRGGMAGPPAGWQAKACPTFFHEVSRAAGPSQQTGQTANSRQSAPEIHVSPCL